MAVAWWSFLALNAMVAAVAVLSSRTHPQRCCGITRRASSALLQRLRSFSIFSVPSSDCFHDTTGILEPDAVVVDAQESLLLGAHDETEKEEPAAVTSPATSSSTRELVSVLTVPAPEAEEDDDEEGDPNAMSMDEAYALVVAARQRPESEREPEARVSEVDAKAEEFIRRFKENLREQQRLNSIFS